MTINWGEIWHDAHPYLASSGLLAVAIQFFRNRNFGGPLLAPLLVSIFFDLFSRYLIESGSWNILTSFVYTPMAVVASMWAFGMLIRSRTLFGVVYVVSAVVLTIVMGFVIFDHGLDRTNLVTSNIASALCAPVVLAISVMLELDEVINGKGRSRSVRILNRAWILYFALTYVKWTTSFLTPYLTQTYLFDLWKTTLNALHLIAYLTISFTYIALSIKLDLKKEWRKEMH